MAALHVCLVAVCEAGAGTGFTLTHFFRTVPLKTELYYRIKASFADRKPSQTNPVEKQNNAHINPYEAETTETSISA